MLALGGTKAQVYTRLVALVGLPPVKDDRAVLLSKAGALIKQALAAPGEWSLEAEDEAASLRGLLESRL